MARDISIKFSLQDNFTKSLQDITKQQDKFKKDLQELNTDLTKLNDKKIELKLDSIKARESLKNTKKDATELGVSFDDLYRERAGKQLAIEQELKDTSKQIKETEKDIRSLTGEMSKLDNSIGSKQVSGGTTGNTGTSGAGFTDGFSQLAKAGLFKHLGDSVSGALSSGVSSMFGSSNGNAIGSIASGAMTGAAIGSIIPGIGTAIGAAVGTVAGGINAAVGKFNEKDDAFKSVVQSNYELVKALEDNTLANGSQIAGSREKDKIAFGTLLGGDDVADSFLNDLTSFAAKTPFQFEQLTTMSRTLLAYGYKMEDIVPLLTKVGDGGSALGMSAQDINVVATMLGRMNSTGKANLEYLNPLLERGVPVFDFLATSLGVSNDQVQEMLTKGLIPGQQAAEAIANAMGEKYAGNMEKTSQTFEGLTSTLTDLQNQMDSAMGEAYNEKRKEGLNAEIEFLSGESGQKMQEAYAMIGEWKASLENEHDEAIRNAMDAMMATAEYKTAEAEGDKVKMGQLLAEAQVKGENEYKAGAGYQEQLKSDMELIGKIRDDTALNSQYYDTGYKMGQEFSKGVLAAKREMITPDVFTLPSGYGASTSSTNKNTPTKAPTNTGYNQPYSYTTPGKSRAIGENRVPYDGYEAILHEGERILTRPQADNYSKVENLVNNTSNKTGLVSNSVGSGSSNVNINFNGTVVKEQADIDNIVKSIVAQLEVAGLITVDA